MLQRVLETEVMDTPAEALDYDSMDHTEVNGIFAHDFLAFCRPDGPILDVGTGTAQIPIELCRGFPTAQITGVDLAESMLQVGRGNIQRAGLTQSIELRHIDAKAIPFPAGHFAAVISNSIVHHIPEPSRAIAEMVRVTRPGGALFIRDLLRPQNDAEVRRLVEQYAGTANAHQRQMFDDSLRAALTLDEIRALVALHGFDPAEVRQTSDRHWTWSAHKQ